MNDDEGIYALRPGGRLDVLIGIEIRAFREAAGFEQAAASQLLDISASRLALYESGEFRLPASMLLQMARLFRFSLAELFERVA